MLVGLHLGVASGELEGVWYELGAPDDAVTYFYRDELSVICLQGVDRMLRRPAGWTWLAYWTYLTQRIDGVEWWEIVEVDDESYPDEWLHGATIHPVSEADDLECWGW